MPPKKTTTPMTDEAIRALIAQGIADPLAEHEANRSRNGGDNHDSGSDERRRKPIARECTYTDFLKCQPLNFKGTEGVVGLTQWFEKMKSVFHISNCAAACQIKFATCTLQGNALTWWNSHVRTISHEVAYGMTWKALKKMLTNKYYPRELALMCGRMFLEESDEVEKYVGGLPDMIHGRHYKSYCPELKNQNHENQAGGTEARGMVYALGGGETDQDLDDMEDDINA
ncbi:reverse transcriptase domain-containing protein [Tanacetum coccineum]